MQGHNYNGLDYVETGDREEFAAFDRLSQRCRRLLQYAPIMFSATEALAIHEEYGEEIAYNSLILNIENIHENFGKIMRFDTNPPPSRWTVIRDGLPRNYRRAR